MRSIVVVILLVGAARADEVAVAREHYLKGTRSYDLGFYEEAAQEYMAAYRAKDDPSLLYDIAQAYRLGGHEAEAVRFYRGYLRKVPRTVNRGEIEIKIAELERTLEQHRRTQTQLPPDQVLKPAVADTQRHLDADESAALAQNAPAAPPLAGETSRAVAPPAPSSANPAFDQRRARFEQHAGIATGVAGLAFTIAGAAMLALAIDTAGQLGQRFDPSLDSTNTTYRALAGAFLSVGVAATTAGIVVYAIGRRAAHRARAQVSVGGSALRVIF